MNINELDSFKLSDAVKFHNRLNPKIWGRDEQLLPEVREKLLAIADNFREFLGVGDLDVRDITISGSNAAYSYTPYSDIDLHLVVEFPADDEVYQELFNAKKYQYNDEHKLSIGGVPVELYVQNAAESPVSQGEYSISRGDWIQVPRRKRARIDDTCVRAKVEDLDARIHSAIESGNAESMSRLWDKIKAMRQSGLDAHGEFGCENIVFKILRNKGCIKDLRTARTAAQDHELSLQERRKKKSRVRYGFGSYWSPGFGYGGESGEGGDGGGGESMREGHQGQPYSSEDGVAASTQMFLNEDDTESMVQQFIQDTAERLGIERMPEIVLHDNDGWSEQNRSFGMYQPELHVLHVNLRDRHVMDILRTVAHELAHCRQHEIEQLDPNAGATGSPVENEANAVAGIIMRDFADAHPDLFDHKDISESSGYIPTKAQADDPRFKMALTVDVQPGQTGKEANKMRLATDAQGHPQVLRADGKVKLAESLAQEFELFEEQDLFEINMGAKSLRKEAAKTGAIAGMEFEMIVPGIKSEDPEMEPDYDQDERCVSIDDAVNFFHDGDYNGRREVAELRDRMYNDFTEWQDDKIRDTWGMDGEEYLREWIVNNVDEDEWADLDADKTDSLDQFVANVYADPSSDYFNQAFDEYREENQDNWDESDWLDAEDLDRMSGIESAYDISWPHWTSMNSGEIDADQVADEFSRAVGREVRVNTRYHQSGARPDPNNQFYVVEPDASLDGDNDGDEGLEFVSPPMPIDELLKDLNAVKEWAGRMGVYTNSSTGLHINISVPNYSVDRLDYVKLALLLGDEYVLKQFGRSSNTYAKSALGKVRDRVRSNPEDAQRLLDKMKGQMGELASKAIHSGSTDKYTSINTKSGHIEFRSPGGDWLDENFDKIENTLLRFTVAMSAALNPEAYREEYQKKLYKLLTQDQKGSDTIKYFADYVAGKIPKAALRSFVKQAQLQRKTERDKTSGEKMWWRVSNPGNSYASVEVVATSKEEAIEKALGDDGYPSWANTRQSIVAEPVRPYEDTTVPTLNGRPSNPDGNWFLRNIDTDEIIYKFNAANYQDAYTVLQQWKDAHPGSENIGYGKVMGSGQSGRPNDPNGRYAVVPRSDPALYGQSGRRPEYLFRFNMGNPAEQAQGRYILQAWAARNNVVPADYMVVDTEQWDQPADTAQTDVNPLRPTGPGPWEVANRNNNQVYYNPEFTNRGAAESEARTWLSQNGHNPNDFEVRTREGSRSDAEQNGIIDIEPDISQYVQPGSTADLAQQRATPGTFSGAWKVMNVDTGQELYRFSGVGNVQSDANGVALEWIRRNAPNTDLVQIEVVPIMTEGVAEGMDRYGNFDPPGPESPPTMPAGTVRVDVSDVYDWYKLGQHISNMKGLGKHDFGKGPPGAILSFGDEDLEHQYIQALKQTGLTTTDIDPVDPNQPVGIPRQKTDPTYNVNELEEDWKSALATGAMAGAMAMGASAKVPEIVRQAVEPGDTVYSIARQNNVNPIEIFKLNKMDRNTKLEIGQKVLVPDYSKPAVTPPAIKSQPTKVAQPAASKVSPAQDSEVTLLSMNSDAEAALQTAAKAAGLRGVELAQFMAQTRHESWDFSKMKEVGNKQRFAKYEKPKLAKQLGNKVKGDGELFKGRGFIQLTGRDNYTRASKQIFGDDRLVKNPDLASRLDVGAQIALWFWKNQVRPNVKNFNNTTEVVKAINASEPMHVVQQRHNKFKEYLAVL